MLQVFFGTPHRGSSIADFGAAVNSIAKFLDRRELLSSLTSQNSTLLEISRDFVALVGIFNYSIVSFFEENRIAGVRLVSRPGFLANQPTLMGPNWF